MIDYNGQNWFWVTEGGFVIGVQGKNTKVPMAYVECNDHFPIHVLMCTYERQQL